jgi:DNA-binding beta-propeller fold protein YncE
VVSVTIALQRSITGFVSPDDVAIRDDGLRMVAVETNKHRLRWTALPATTNFSTAGIYVNGTGAGLAFPEAVTFDSAQRLVVLDLWNRRVVRYAPQGASYIFDATYSPSLSVGGVGLGYARDLALDSAGVLYVLDSQNRRIVRAGSPATAIPLPSQVVAPWGMALRSAGGFLVVDRAGHRVYGLSPAGAIDFQFGVFGRTAAQLRFPEHVAVAPSGNIWVADTDNNRIQEFSASGAFIRIVLVAEQFRQIRRLRFAPNGWLYVADPGAGAVHEIADAVPKRAVHISPVRVNFRDVGVGSTAQSTVKVSNVGSNAVQLQTVSCSAGPFEQSPPIAGLPVSIAAGSTELIPVRFASTQPGAEVGFVKVETDAIQNVRTVSLVGTAHLVPSISIGFIIDHSQSLNGRFREIVNIDLIKRGLSGIPGVPPFPPYGSDLSVGLVYFNEAAEIGLPMTSLRDGGLEALERALQHGPRPEGMTSIGAGIIGGLELLRSSNDGKRVLVILTDGPENSPPLLADLEIPPDVSVYAIGLGSGDELGARELDALCRAHRGSLRLTGQAFDRIPRLLAETCADIFGYQMVVSQDVRLAGDVARIPLSISSSDHRLSCAVHWSDPSSVFEVQLEGPGGDPIEAKLLARDFSSPTSRVLEVSLPVPIRRRRLQSGEWALQVQRIKGPRAPGDIQVAAIVQSDLTLNLDIVPPLVGYVADGRRSSLSVGDGIRLRLRVFDRGEPVSGEVTSASDIYRPQGSTLTRTPVIQRARKLVTPSLLAGDPLPIRAALANASLARDKGPGPSPVSLERSPIAVDGWDLSAGRASAPGAHRLNVLVRCRGHDGQMVTRVRSVTVYVEPEIAMGHSSLELTSYPGPIPTSRLIFTPRDRFGNPLGSGWGDALTVNGDSVALVGTISDRGDGSYAIEFTETAGEGSRPDRITFGFLGRSLEIALPQRDGGEDRWTNHPAKPISSLDHSLEPSRGNQERLL